MGNIVEIEIKEREYDKEMYLTLKEVEIASFQINYIILAMIRFGFRLEKGWLN